MTRSRRPRRIAASLAVVLGLGAAVFAFLHMRKVQAADQVALAPSRSGDFQVIVRCRGELKARRSVQISAPVVPNLRIVWLAPPGSPIAAGAPVVRFDPSSARQEMQEKQAALKQAEAGLEQAIADARSTAEQDRRDLATSRYDVEKARLEASKAEILSRLQGEESKVDLGLAEQKLLVAEATAAMHDTSGKAKMASLRSQRDKAKAELLVTQGRLDRMELKSPISGIITYLSNTSQGWMNAKPFQVGDQAWPGAALAEIPDLSTLEMEGKVEEIDRGRIALNNPVRVHVDALPELNLSARLAAISPLTEQSFEWPPTRSFRGYAHLENSDARLRPGMNGRIDIVVNHIAGAISVPAKSIFTRKGKPIVYVARGGRYELHEVEILARNPDEVAVKGIPAAVMLTLVDVEKRESKP